MVMSTREGQGDSSRGHFIRSRKEVVPTLPTPSSTVNERPLYSCLRCKIQMASIEELIVHHNSRHGCGRLQQPTHVPAFKCLFCDSMYLDCLDSLLNHLDASHGGRARLLNNLDPSVIERSFSIVHHSFTTSVLPSSSSSPPQLASLIERKPPFPRDENVWKEWFVSCFAPYLRVPIVLARSEHSTSTSSMERGLSTSSEASTAPPSQAVAEVSSSPSSSPTFVSSSESRLADESVIRKGEEIEKRRQRRTILENRSNSRTKTQSASQLLARTCVECRIVFDNRCMFTRHLLEHKQGSHPFKCLHSACLMTYDSLAKLSCHLARKHGVEGDALKGMLALYQRAEEAIPSTPRSSHPALYSDSLFVDSPAASVKVEEGAAITLKGGCLVLLNDDSSVQHPIKQELPEDSAKG